VCVYNNYFKIYNEKYSSNNNYPYVKNEKTKKMLQQGIKQHMKSFSTLNSDKVKTDYSQTACLHVERLNQPNNIPTTSTYRGREEIGSFFKDMFSSLNGNLQAFKGSRPTYFEHANTAMVRWSAPGIPIGVDTFVVNQEGLITFQSVTMIYGSGGGKNKL
jgi:hypothetical protein